MFEVKNKATSIKCKLNVIVFGIMAVVLLPVLFCVFFIGNNMNYMEGLKLAYLRPSYILFPVALLGMVVCALLVRWGERIVITKKVNWIINGVLILLFVVLYFINERVTREIAYLPPWDIMVVRGTAYQVASGETLGAQYYYSANPNNIPIMYVLGMLYRFAHNLPNYPYVCDFIWLQINCILVSVAGFFSCLSVKKVTKNVMATAITFFVYALLVGTTGWKIAAYTDTYSMIFTIIAVYFYIVYRECEKNWSKFLLIFIILLNIFVGGYIKASLYLLVLAFFGVEILDSLDCFRKKWKYILAGVVISLLFSLGTDLCTDAIAESTGLERNEEIANGWENYLLMGQNEASTGNYETDDYALYSQYMDNKAIRRPFVKKLAFERIAEKGVLGNLYFWLRKMTMVFNDGSFGFGVEIWPYGHYAPIVSTNSDFTEFMRGFYWGGPYKGAANTLLQTLWYFVLVGLPGILLVKKEEKNRYMIWVVSFLGIFFYQMLFEARARYLFTFLPLIIPLSIFGMQQYSYLFKKIFRGKACQQK